MKLTSDQIKRIRNIAEPLLSGATYDVYLFGSYAMGGASEKSDIDLAIKGKEPLPLSLWSKLECEFDDSEIPQKVDIVDYLRVSDDFKKVILANGILLFSTLGKVPKE